jgi:dipeptidyl aminopeptidase/acylaminoacyl peptidase
MFAFSPDGREIAFSAARSVDHPSSVFIMNRSGERLHRMTLQPFLEDGPIYSPDGRFIAIRTAALPGPRQTDLAVYSRKDHVVSILTGFFDLDVREITWSRDSERLYFTAPDQGREVLFSVEIRSRKIRGLAYTGCLGECQASPVQDRLYFKRTQAHQPAELYSSNENGEDVSQLTFINPTSPLAMNPLEEFWFPSFDGKTVHGFILKPPRFNASEKYPLILSIHDGPHDASRDAFEFRWNHQLLASRGTVVLAVNYRGSIGFGQEFSEASQKEWGGAPYKDLMAGLDYAIGKYSFIDSDRMAACGEFFGGFLTHWIAGHTDRFKCLIAQSGIADPYSFYFETDDPSWLEWELGSAPFNDEKIYDKWTPLHFAKDFTTPMLIIQGGRDSRNPQGGLKMHAALNRLDVPVKLLYFEDEGRHIERPSHIRLFWQTVLDWMDRWIGEQNQP